MTQDNDQGSQKPRNLWVQIVSAIAGIYLIFSLMSPMFLNQGQQPPKKIETPDLLLIALILLFNSGLINRLEDFAISKDGGLTAKFDTLEGKVDTLSDSIDELLLRTVLDAFEYATLKDLEGETDKKFEINPSGYALLERLRNRGLIEEKNKNNKVLADRRERPIWLKESFSITEQGGKYLKLVKDRELDQQLNEIFEQC